MKTQSTYPLRLPRSIKAEVERRAKEDGISINQFVATAVAEKLARLEKSRLAQECAKLDSTFEKALAEEGLSEDLAEWPEY